VRKDPEEGFSISLGPLALILVLIA